MGVCPPKETLNLLVRMDALIRIVKPSSASCRWSFQLDKKESLLFFTVQRKDISGGWADDFWVSLQNHTGEYQHVRVPKHTEQQLSFPLNLYVSFRAKPDRQFWKIPPFIFQTWKSGEKTSEMKDAISSFSSQPGYTHICWNDVECCNFLFNVFGDRYAKAYSLLVPGAYRADFWRYCILYKFGGVYADAKTTCLRSLDEIIRPDDELILVRDIPDTCLLNGFIACSPGHPLLGLVIEMVLENIESRTYGKDPLDITGPHVFGKAFCRWKGYPEDSVSLFAGYTKTLQILHRHQDKVHIISPEGEKLFVKEYDTYYKKDVDVSTHYPQLWTAKAIYSDQPPYTKK
jgi:hypothetical protein